EHRTPKLSSSVLIEAKRISVITASSGVCGSGGESFGVRCSLEAIFGIYDDPLAYHLGEPDIRFDLVMRVIEQRFYRHHGGDSERVRKMFTWVVPLAGAS